MRHRTRKLKIKTWDEGAELVVVVKPDRTEPRLHPGFSLNLVEEEAILSRSLKPVGFYVAYSYTLFRTSDDPRGPFYALF